MNITAEVLTEQGHSPVMLAPKIDISIPPILCGKRNYSRANDIEFKGSKCEALGSKRQKVLKQQSFDHLRSESKYTWSNMNSEYKNKEPCQVFGTAPLIEIKAEFINLSISKQSSFESKETAATGSEVALSSCQNEDAFGDLDFEIDFKEMAQPTLRRQTEVVAASAPLQVDAGVLLEALQVDQDGDDDEDEYLLSEDEFDESDGDVPPVLTRKNAIHSIKTFHQVATMFS